MGGLIIALVPVLQGLLAGGSATAVFGGLTIAQWTAIASAIATLANPEVEAELSKLDPRFASLISDIKLFGPTTAADNAARVAFGFEDPSNPGMFK